MAGVAERLAEIRDRLECACRKAGRSANEVKLLAVSKTFPAEAVQEAFEAGQREFGESRQQEGSEKVGQLPEEIVWHFIGKLQRNKARKVLADFGVLQSIDSLKLARHVDRIAGEEGLRPKGFLEINLGGEDSKGGFSTDTVLGEIEDVAGLPHLSVCGVMVIPPVEGEARRWFAEARGLRDELRRKSGMGLPELSMGMSGDFEDAILEGSTMVRVGSAIFGTR